LGIDYTSKPFEIGNYQIILLDSNFNLDGSNSKPGKSYTTGSVPEDELKWLAQKLKSSKKKTKIVFIHHPPLVSVPGRGSEGLMQSSPALQELFTKYNVSAVFSGHIEQLYHEKIQGVHYYVLPGLAKHEDFQGAYTTIEYNGSSHTVTLTYLDNNNTYVTTKVH
jgi:Icc-related predicted phosphoesterase